jgi:hypothetical protein
MIDTKALARHYDTLTPEERFGLILAAGSRGDQAERDRLVNSGGRIAHSMQDHAPTPTPSMSWSSSRFLAGQARKAIERGTLAARLEMLEAVLRQRKENDLR